MKHTLKSLVFAILIIFTALSYAQEISISGVYYPNTPITLIAEAEGTWKIESKPVYSEAKLIQNGSAAVFTNRTAFSNARHTLISR